MSNSGDHPHVPIDPSFLSTPARRRYRPSSPHDIDEGLENLFNFEPSRQLTLLDIDVHNGVRSYPIPVNMDRGLTGAAAQIPIAEMTLEQRLEHLTRLAEVQQKQMEEANAFAARQADQLQASQQQLRDSQQTVQQLSNAFQALSAQPQRSAQAPKKKPELPPFDSKNVLIWIRRIEAAYARVGVVEAKDKFAWLESLFQVKLNPRIDSYLYGNNTETDWSDFIQYLKDEYGPTKRQKAQKLLAENSRHDMKPTQFLTQLEEDTKDVTVDDVRKEHLLKTLPPGIRQMMGKDTEAKSAKEVAAWADQFFDRQGRPLERSINPINSISSSSSTTADSTASSSSSSSFTHAFGDDDTDINFVKRGGFNGGGRGRGMARGNRSNSRSRFGNFSNSSSSASQAPRDASQHHQQQHPPGTCRFHRKFGDQANKCVSDCPKFKSFSAQQKQQGNANGGRRM